MKKCLMFVFLVIFFAGCTKAPSDEKMVMVKIHNYEITKDEFEQEFRDSYFSRNDTLEARKEFLDNLVNRKLILQEAQKKGMDKDEKFLKLIEKFWEQSLLRVALEQKARENAGRIFVSDKAVEEVYQSMVKEKKITKPYAEVYNQIKWEITKLMEAQAMAKWVAELRKGAEVRIKYNLLDNPNRERLVAPVPAKPENKPSDAKKNK